TRLHAGSTRALESLRVELEATRDIPSLARWFQDAFATLVMENLRITGALTAAIPLWPFAAPDVVTAAMAREMRALEEGAHPRHAFEARWGHRGEYETDPAWPRGEEARSPGSSLSTMPRPALPDPLAALPAPLQRLPFLAPRHLRAHREWFRDSAMRLW